MSFKLISVHASEGAMGGHHVNKNFVKPRENSNFMKNGKMIIFVKIRNFSRFQMTKRTSPLESSREI